MSLSSIKNEKVEYHIKRTHKLIRFWIELVTKISIIDIYLHLGSRFHFFPDVFFVAGAVAYWPSLLKS